LGMAVSLGRPKLKGITQRFSVYALLPEKPTGLRQTLQVQRLKLSRRVGTVVFVLVSVSILVVGGIILFLYSSRPPLSTQHSGLQPRQQRYPYPTNPPSSCCPLTT